MNQRLPAEFEVLGNKIEGMSDEVVSVFRYSMVEDHLRWLMGF